ncbi:hypothetical protein [Methylorubrum suomiense]|uniref:Uncharacterized protein n=1 Tax=Methylorubrum suomiense TaxID=144191 RepID=A0ABQ4UVV8_9HYPH|nr:hypothetical protein [Methylorubrum suomiense]GJE76441.1 hypothetical protein BGCPKDLD_3035 [Methylorubrum suomiense]
MSVRALAAGFAAGLAALLLAPPARADACDALTVRLIRATGASLVGRIGPLVVFRAADAERFRLQCASPRTLLFRSADREPPGATFVLIGQAARALTGAPEAAVETLSRQLHQDSLLTGEPQVGRVGGAVIRCDPGDRPDGFGLGTLCRVAADRPQGNRERLRRKAGLPAEATAG